MMYICVRYCWYWCDYVFCYSYQFVYYQDSLHVSVDANVGCHFSWCKNYGESSRVARNCPDGQVMFLVRISVEFIRKGIPSTRCGGTKEVHHSENIYLKPPMFYHCSLLFYVLMNRLWQCHQSGTARSSRFLVDRSFANIDTLRDRLCYLLKEIHSTHIIGLRRVQR